jgi:hypothetical protein
MSPLSSGSKNKQSNGPVQKQRQAEVEMGTICSSKMLAGFKHTTQNYTHKNKTITIATSNPTSFTSEDYSELLKPL